MKVGRVAKIDICALGIYVLINTLFVYKYSSRIIQYPWMTVLLYIVSIYLVILLLIKKYKCKLSQKKQNVIYFSTTVILSILLTLLMIRFDPQTIRVGRYPALFDWINRLLNSEFPYDSSSNPSGFPFLFVLAIPFYLLGDVGYLQIFGFITFAFLVYYRHCHCSENRFRVLILLITSPIFMYEIVVRSELFTNIVLILLYLGLFEKVKRDESRLVVFLLGTIGGFLLSTRGIVFLIYLTYFGFLLKEKIITHISFFIFLCAGFLFTLLPFLVWNWRYFIQFGPFAIQLSYVPLWLLILSIVVSVSCALKIESLGGIYSAVSFILFGVVFVPFIVAVLNEGWNEIVLGNGFDISYFCFTLPFTLISIDFGETTHSVANKFFTVHTRPHR